TDAMDDRPYLVEIGRQLKSIGLEAVLIGNAAAALQGAPVTTVDFDFMFRKTPRNLRKLKTLATALGATVMRPYYPASDLYRVVRDVASSWISCRRFTVFARSKACAIEGKPSTSAARRFVSPRCAISSGARKRRSACGPSEAPEGSAAQRRRRARASGGWGPASIGNIHAISPCCTCWRPR